MDESVVTGIAVQVLSSLVGQSPTFLAMLVGAILAIVRWSRHPGVSALVLSAVAIAVLTSLAAMFIFAILPRAVADWEPAAIGWTYSIIGFVTATLYAVVWGLLLVAAFGWRQGFGCEPVR